MNNVRTYFMLAQNLYLYTRLENKKKSWLGSSNSYRPIAQLFVIIIIFQPPNPGNKNLVSFAVIMNNPAGRNFNGKFLGVVKQNIKFSPLIFLPGENSFFAYSAPIDCGPKMEMKICF